MEPVWPLAYSQSEFPTQLSFLLQNHNRTPVFFDTAGEFRIAVPNDDQSHLLHHSAQRFHGDRPLGFDFVDALNRAADSFDE